MIRSISQIFVVFCLSSDFCLKMVFKELRFFFQIILETQSTPSNLSHIRLFLFPEETKGAFDPFLLFGYFARFLLPLARGQRSRARYLGLEHFLDQKTVTRWKKQNRNQNVTPGSFFFDILRDFCCLCLGAKEPVRVILD